MSVEEQVDRAVSSLDVGNGDLAAVLAVSGRRRTRFRATLASCSLAVVVVVAVGVVHGRLHADRGPVDHPSAGSWRHDADLPIGPRWGAIVVWTGHEVLAIGGATTGLPIRSNPNPEKHPEDQARFRGAAFDPVTGKWHRIADAPKWFTSDNRNYTMVGTNLIIESSYGRWYRYDTTADRWGPLPSPPSRTTESLVAVGDHADAVTDQGQVVQLSPTTWTWVALPPLPRPAGVLIGGASLLAVGRPDVGTPGDVDTYELTGDTWRPVARDVGNFISVGSVRASARSGNHILTLGANADGVRPLQFGATDLDMSTGTNSRVLLPSGLNADGLDSERGVFPSAVSETMLTAFGLVHDLTSNTWADLRTPWKLGRVGTNAAWVGNQLVVIGGLDGNTPTGQVWTWTPTPDAASSPQQPATASTTTHLAQALTVHPVTLRPSQTASIATAPGVAVTGPFVMSRHRSPSVGNKPTYALHPGSRLGGGLPPSWENWRPPTPGPGGLRTIGDGLKAAIVIPTTAGNGTWWICTTYGPHMCAPITIEG